MTYRPLVPFSLVVAAALAGCGVVPLDAQWKDPSQPAESLRGTTVLVVCESDEQVVKQMCQDRVAAELRSLGANTAVVPHSADGASVPLSDEARAVKARAIFNTKLSPDWPRYVGGSGVSVGVGMGGGFGRGAFGGVGVSAPIGGASRVSQGYVANASLSDAATGRLMWTGRASTHRSTDIDWQVDSLTKAVVSGAQQAGFF